MKSIRAVALLLALSTVYTVCHSAQSERSRHRSGPIRSVPVAADIKRDSNFECPEEFGYYPHPTDCTLYYVCVFGGALLESCTGGLMYSHELQTCDWPRNVGCEATSAVGGEELERLQERERDPPPPPPPRRAPLPPPPPRAQPQPNPVVTSRGQPKIITREEYEQQQQLYEEVDDLPPVDEIENDRQQRVYRGQPSTIGQVQRDRDGYSQVNSGRTLNSNIIPASIPQNHGKIGSFSFGTQVEDRRQTVTATQTPQSYSIDIGNKTGDLHDRQSYIETNKIDFSSTKHEPNRRKKREATEPEIVEDTLVNNAVNATNVTDPIAERSDIDVDDYLDLPTELSSDEIDGEQDDIDRGKRQIRHGRYYFKNGPKNTGKYWSSPKPINLPDLPNLNAQSSAQNFRYQPHFNSLSTSHFDGTSKPHFDEALFSTANPFLSYHVDTHKNQQQFKPSLPDPFNQKFGFNPLNTATHIITKSPPISSLTHHDNPFAAFAAGGFFNNNQHGHSPNQESKTVYRDSSQVPSTVVTGKPLQQQTKYKPNVGEEPIKLTGGTHTKNLNGNQQQAHKGHTSERIKQEGDNSEEDSSDESEESSKDEDSEDTSPDHGFKHDFPEPPYEFTHPSHKFKDIENPFADPNFDFDSFLAKLSGRPVSDYKPSPRKPQPIKNAALTVLKPSEETSSVTPQNSGIRSSTLNYMGMSTPRPFSTLQDGRISWPQDSGANLVSTKQPSRLEQYVQRPPNNQGLYQPQPHLQQQEQHHQQLLQQQQKHQQQQQSVLVSNKTPQQNFGVGQVRPKLKPPNFDDNRQLPINFNFNQGLQSSVRPFNMSQQSHGQQPNKHFLSVTPKPYYYITGTGAPIRISTPKQFFVKPENIIALQPQLSVTGKPFLVSTGKPHNSYIVYKQSTPKPLTTVANEQLSLLQNLWGNQSKGEGGAYHSTLRPTTELPKLENLFAPPTKQSVLGQTSHNINQPNSLREHIFSSTKAPAKRRPIPKPSPEMNDYYYDDDELYYEPPVKSQYMPSTEVRPKRPPMAQNFQEYEDSESYEDDEEEVKPQGVLQRRPYNTYQVESATKNLNDVSVAVKSPYKDTVKNSGKVIMFATPSPNVLMRPEVSNYQIMHQPHRNKTLHLKRPMHYQIGPQTQRPPKYLNQTTLRPYTVRHRLAKPTTVPVPSTQSTQSPDIKQTKGRTRHPNIVTQTRVTMTTPRDSQKQETRYTKTRHDDKTNSLEPTESITPTSYTARPAPKMLFNGTQNYNPQQYDPYYAVYDEDGELYKDTDYVQQYNLASPRPAVQQTYRGTPPPAPSRRPVETYTTRPVTPEDYDDALIQGQINNQNQYDTAVRHSTRGEGNELGYDHNLSSVRTTVYEATSISTTPSTTTSTSTTTTTTTTTTQRPTVAPLTEAMTPSQNTPRSSTDENSKDPLLSQPAYPSTPTSTSPPVVNFSSLAKPFEKTENTHRLQGTLTSNQRLLPPDPTSHDTNKSQVSVESILPLNKSEENKNIVSLTTGFSIRRNLNNTNNPYTLTVITRPFGSERSQKVTQFENVSNIKLKPSRFYYENDRTSKERSMANKSEEETVSGNDSSMRRKDSSPEITSEDYDLPRFETLLQKNIRQTTKSSLLEPTNTKPTKYYLKKVIKRPASFSLNGLHGSTENSIDTEDLIEKALQNTRNNTDKNENSSADNLDTPKWEQYDDSNESKELVDAPYKSRRTDTKFKSSTIKTTTSTTVVPNGISAQFETSENYVTSTSRPHYYSYRVLDDVDVTTEVFAGKARNILKAFFSTIVGTHKPPKIVHVVSTARPSPETERVVNIGFQKQFFKYGNDVPVRNSYNRLQIITEPSSFVSPTLQPTYQAPYIPSNSDQYSDSDRNIGFSSTLSSTPSSTMRILSSPPTESTTESYLRENQNTEHQSKFSSFIETEAPTKFQLLTTTEPAERNSIKFHQIISDQPTTESVSNIHDSFSFNKIDNDLTRLTKIDSVTANIESQRPIADKTSTTTSTTTELTKTAKATQPTTKSLSFPTRASRVNSAIKLAAASLGGGRRSYQSPSNCSSDNSLQANPKCNEIKYQRPSSTRGRGSAHYSTLTASEAPQAPNRGTPPTRSRPTLKPSTAIVSKSTEFVDIYAYPPRRPAPVYPQPTPDKTAAKCRKDVCQLPDCSCGGKDIPGNLPINDVPQMVLITFDDAVNDLNKMYYEELFEKGRVNPNGCPISATFYVSHEWTDYSQVQNLYADGHEFASHTVSHSFGEQFSQKKWNKEVGGQREILSAYGGVKLEDVRGMRAPFLSVGGNKMFKMLYDSNFTYDSSMPVYENRPPSWPYTLDYKLFHDCMIPPCPTKSYPGVWEVPMVMWQDLNGGRCSMGDACANPPNAEGVYKMLLKNFDRHYTTNRAPFGLFYHAAWFTQPHHKEGFIMFLDFINRMQDVWVVTNWQALQWVRDPTPISRINNFQPFQCDYPDRPKKCNSAKVCNLWHKSGVRYMRTCQPCPEIYPWTGKTGIKSSRIDNEIEES